MGFRRGLALDSGLAKAEEFPVFREFWIEKPRPDSTSLRVFTLLNSPSATGAYQFVIHPGIEVSMEHQMPAVHATGRRALGDRAFDQSDGGAACRTVGGMGLSSGRPQMQCLTEWPARYQVHTALVWPHFP